MNDTCADDQMQEEFNAREIFEDRAKIKEEKLEEVRRIKRERDEEVDELLHTCYSRACKARRMEPGEVIVADDSGDDDLVFVREQKKSALSKELDSFGEEETLMGDLED